MANVTFAKKQKPGQDFFPLTVHYKKNITQLVKFPVASSNAKHALPKKRH